MIKLKGDTADQKLQHMERVLNRMITEVHRPVTVVIPPTLISHFVERPDKDGVCFRYLFPVTGTITAGSLHMDAKEGDVELTVRIFSGEQGLERKIPYHQPVTLSDLNIPVNAGDRMQILVDGVVKGIWLGLVYSIPREHVKTVQTYTTREDFTDA